MITLFVIIITASGSISFADDEIEEPYTGVFLNEAVKTSGKPVIDAAAAVVMDFASGRVLYSKNAIKRRAIASTTKIMTAIVAIENGCMEDTVVISNKAASVWGSTINLKKDSKYKLEELLYGLLLNSGNDASIAIAEHIGGSVDEFVKMMNAKAVDLGAADTAFVNTHGLDAEGHFSTAYDMALIARYALKNKQFSKIVGTVNKNIPGRQLYNTNEMLRLYQGADGVKTGYTGKAGRCLVTSATRNGMRLISVVLGSPTTYKRALSTKSMLDYVFANYKKRMLLTEGKEVAKIPVYKGVDEYAIIKTTESIEIPLSDEEYAKLNTRVVVPEGLTAPIYAGIDSGCMEFEVDGEIIAQTTLKTWYNVERKGFEYYLGAIFKRWLRIVNKGVFN